MGSKKHRNRPFPVPAGRALVQGTLSGDGAIRVAADGSLRIDPTRMLPPQNIYDADYAWVERRLGAVSLFFAKGYPGKSPKKLRTRVELRYPYGPFLNHFWGNSRQFHERLRTYVTANPFEAEPTTAKPSEMEADRDHSDWVNFDYLAHTGSEAALDFFHVPPSGIARFAQGQGTSGLTLTPVLRIHTTAYQLCSLLDACAPIAKQLEEHSSHEDSDE